MFVYKKCLIPSIASYLKLKHSNVLDLKVRNSLNDKLSFNLFFSDIDICIVVLDGSATDGIIKDFLILKRLLPMLDYPEVYTSNEYDLLEILKKKNTWIFIDLFWNIRKVNWCKASLEKDKSPLNEIKLKRSILKSLKKILNSDIDFSKKQYFLSDYKHLDALFDTKKRDLAISCYSDFLSNNNGHGNSLVLSRLQYMYINALMPGDDMDIEIRKIVSPFFLECKNDIAEYEKLITKTSIRLKLSMGENCDSALAWLEFMEQKR